MQITLPCPELHYTTQQGPSELNKDAALNQVLNRSFCFDLLNPLSFGFMLPKKAPRKKNITRSNLIWHAPICSVRLGNNIYSDPSGFGKSIQTCLFKWLVMSQGSLKRQLRLTHKYATYWAGCCFLVIKQGWKLQHFLQMNVRLETSYGFFKRLKVWHLSLSVVLDS